MDFDLTEDQTKLHTEISRFAERELNDDLARRDEAGEFSPEAWKKCASMGILGLPMPKDYRGEGADPLTTMVALEALGYGCRDNGLVFSLNAQMWSCEIPLLRFGDEEQKRSYLPRLCDGSLIGVQAMSEPGSGSDAFGLQTTARRRDDRYVLDGSKTFVTNAPVADLFVVFASTDPSQGASGITAFLVERNSPGLSVGPPLKKMGLRTSPMAEVFFSDCEVEIGNRLGPEGAGMTVFNTSMEWERSFILAAAVGRMQWLHERVISYAKERRQFGQPIGNFQAISHRIVDMKLRLETARLLLYKVGWLKTQGKRSPMEAAMVKLYVSECLVKSALDAIQIHGGYGYLTDYELEREARDAIGSRIYSGTSEIQKNIIAGYLGL